MAFPSFRLGLLSSSSSSLDLFLPSSIAATNTNNTTTTTTTTITTRSLVYKPYGKPEPLVAERQRIAELGYWERKKAKKEQRRVQYHAQKERQARLATRRAGRNRGVMKRAFRTWFIRKKVDDEYHHRKAKQAGLDWRYQIAAIVQRINVVQPDKYEWEKEYEQLQAQLGVWGKVYPEEFAGKQKIEDHKILTDEELIALLPFTPAPRETEADASGDVRTTNRKLTTFLYLTVQQQQQGAGENANANATDRWQFPTVDLKMDEDETCWEAAKRCVAERVGPSVQIWAPSGCPWSVNVQPYAPEQQKETGLYGCKTFFILMNHEDGEVDPDTIPDATIVKDYAWLDRSEMVERIREQDGETMSKLYHYMLQQL